MISLQTFQRGGWGVSSSTVEKHRSQNRKQARSKVVCVLCRCLCFFVFAFVCLFVLSCLSHVSSFVSHIIEYVCVLCRCLCLFVFAFCLSFCFVLSFICVVFRFAYHRIHAVFVFESYLWFDSSAKDDMVRFQSVLPGVKPTRGGRARPSAKVT
jgi:hypothetical protein